MPTTQTSMSAALSKAGMSVTPIWLAQAADEAMKKHHGNAQRAAKTFLKDISARPELMEELALHYLQNYKLPGGDQSIPGAHATYVSDRQTNGDGSGQITFDSQRKNALPLPPVDGGGLTGDASRGLSTSAAPVEPSAAQTAIEMQVRTKAALNVFDRIKTSRGVMWGNIYYRELETMVEDGDLAREVRHHIGSRRGDDRNKQIRELMTPLQFHAVLRKIGRSVDAA